MWILEINGEVLNFSPTKEECEIEANKIVKILCLVDPTINIYLDDSDNWYM